MTPTYLLKLRVHEGKDPQEVYDPLGENAKERAKMKKRQGSIFNMFSGWSLGSAPRSSVGIWLDSKAPVQDLGSIFKPIARVSIDVGNDLGSRVPLAV